MSRMVGRANRRAWEQPGKSPSYVSQSVFLISVKHALVIGRMLRPLVTIDQSPPKPSPKFAVTSVGGTVEDWPKQLPACDGLMGMVRVHFQWSVATVIFRQPACCMHPAMHPNSTECPIRKMTLPRPPTSVDTVGTDVPLQGSGQSPACFGKEMVWMASQRCLSSAHSPCAAAATASPTDSNETQAQLGENPPSSQGPD